MNELDAMGLWDALGTDEIERMCHEIKEQSGGRFGSFENFQHIAHNRRRPSFDSAKAITAWIQANHPEVSVSPSSLIKPLSEINFGKSTKRRKRTKS